MVGETGWSTPEYPADYDVSGPLLIGLLFDTSIAGLPLDVSFLFKVLFRSRLRLLPCLDGDEEFLLAMKSVFFLAGAVFEASYLPF